MRRRVSNVLVGLGLDLDLNPKEDPPLVEEEEDEEAIIIGPS